MLLKDKVAVITGGTRGIGFATAEEFLKEGAKVVIFGSRPETVEAALKNLGKKAAGYSPKLTNKNELEKVFKEIAEKFGGVDILVNNAGTASKTPFSEYSEEEYDKVADLNIKSIFMVTQAALPYLKESHGVVLNTSSMVSIHGQPSGFMYPASKFAVNGITKSLARELAADGIRVNAVAPGIIETDMMKAVPKEMIEPLIQTIPLGRLGQPEDIAQAFAFLASSKASYISGAVLSVDGLARS